MNPCTCINRATSLNWYTQLASLFFWVRKLIYTRCMFLKLRGDYADSGYLRGIPRLISVHDWLRYFNIGVVCKK